jgi:hypothetical protein
MSIQVALQTAQHSWLLPQQVHDLLSNYINYGFKLSTTRPSSPPSSGLYLYDKKSVSNWAEDGGQWSLLKNGFIPVSPHVLVGYMWHEYGALLRRVYWLVSNENVVLVHYLSRSAGLDKPSQQTSMPLTPTSTPSTPSTPTTPTTPVSVKSEPSFQQQVPFLSSVQMMQQCLKGLEDTQLRTISAPTPSPPALTPLQQLGASSGLDMLSPDDLKKLILAQKESRTRGGAGLDLGAFLPQLPSFVPPTNPFSQLLAGSSLGMTSMGMDFFSPVYPSPQFQPLQQQQQQQRQQPQQEIGGMSSGLGRLGMNFLMSNTNSSSTSTPMPTSPVNSRSSSQNSSMMTTSSPSSPEDIDEDVVTSGRRRKKDLTESGRPMDKMQKIRARKAEVARACRIRKKAYIKSLEEKSARLAARLAEVESRLEQSESRNQVYREEQKILLERLSKQPAQPSTSIDIDVPSPGLSFTKIEGESKLDEAKRLIEQMLAHTRRPHQVINKHLAGIEAHIAPVDHVKFLLWACTQSDDFYSKFGWQSLIHKELALSDSQIQSFMELKSSMLSLKKNGFDLQTKLKKLSEEIKRHLTERERGVQDLLTMLTPTQAAKLAVWVDQNAKSMELSPVTPAVVTASYLAPPPPSIDGEFTSMLPTDDLLDTSEDDQMSLFPEVSFASLPRGSLPTTTPKSNSHSPLWSSPFPSTSPLGDSMSFFAS